MFTAVVNNTNIDINTNSKYNHNSGTMLYQPHATAMANTHIDASSKVNEEIMPWKTHTRHDTPQEVPIVRLADLYIQSENGMILVIENIDRWLLYRFSYVARRQLVALYKNQKSGYNGARRHYNGFVSKPALYVKVGPTPKEVIIINIPARGIPPFHIFEILKDWMCENEHDRGDIPLTRVVPGPGPGMTVETLVNILAAAEILDLQPPAFELRRRVRELLTGKVASLEVMQHTWMKLGRSRRNRDAIFAMVKTYFDACNADLVREEESENVMRMLSCEPELYTIFQKVWRGR
ncbi:hypothetical protein BDV97DRAFT_372994 [Delphinella strobiligena]|nr:hypothetical protein BDV97DRAFT_372994 [Delphinella strobiligena]